MLLECQECHGHRIYTCCKNSLLNHEHSHDLWINNWNVLEWYWNGIGMVLEWYWNGIGIVLEWCWNILKYIGI